MTLDELWKRCIFKRDGGLCQRCLSQGIWTPAVDAHHIIHKVAGLFLRYHIDNGVALCRACHDQDAQGRLLRWCVAWMGEDKYYALKREAHSRLGKPFDEVAKKKELTTYLGHSYS
jgi:hypothetical protein